MSRFKKVDPRIWSDKKFKNMTPLAPGGQALWLFLLTNPSYGRVPGLLNLGFGAVQDSLNWPKESLGESFRECFIATLFFADFDAKLIWLPKAILYNKPQNPNIVLSWRDEINSLPECFLRDQALLSLYLALANLGEPYTKAMRNILSGVSGCSFVDNKPFFESSPESLPESFPESLPKGFGISLPEYRDVDIDNKRKPPLRSPLTQKSTFSRGENLCNREGKLPDSFSDDFLTNEKPDVKTAINKKKHFQIPTIAEIQNYIDEKKYCVDAEAFWNFYNSKNWFVGKTKMSNWHSALVTWEKREREKEKSNSDWEDPYPDIQKDLDGEWV